MKYRARRIAIFLGVIAVIGVPSYRYSADHTYSTSDTFSLIMAGLLAAVFLGFTVFVTRVDNNIPQSFVNRCRVASAVLCAALVVTLTLCLHAMARTANDEAAAVSSRFTTWITVDTCWRWTHGAQVDDVDISESEDGSVCHLVVPVDKYSMVIYPDGTNVTLGNMQHDEDASGRTQTVTIPSHGKVELFLYDWKADKAFPLTDTGVDLTQMHYTRINSRCSA